MISPYWRSPDETQRARPVLSPPDNEPAYGFVAWPTGSAAEQTGKGPGQRLRTGVRPAGNGLDLRCLLGARALSTPNPPSSRTDAQASAPFQCHAWPRSRAMLAAPP